MAKIAALGAYLYQSLVAFGLLIVIANLLPAKDYAGYSLFISIVQFADIVCFQWISAASSRFYPGPDQASEQVERGVIGTELAGSGGICLLVAFLGPLFGISIWLGLVGALAAILQGAGELHLTMLRFRQEFRLFSWLQGARATTLALATITGAALRADLAHVVAGVMAGNVIYCTLALFQSRQVMPLSACWDGDIVKRNLAYGGISAGAGVATLLVPLGIKSILLGSLGSAAAGPMLALDLLQRPFVMLTSSLQAIRFPDLVAQFDRKGGAQTIQAELGRYYALLVGLSLIGAAAIVATLSLATQLVVPAGLREAFLHAAPFVMLMAMLRAVVQTVLPTPAQLKRLLPIILGLAIIECVLTCGGALAAAWLGAGTPMAVTAGAATGAAAATLIGVFMQRWRSFTMPWQPVLPPAAALLLAWLISAWQPGSLLISTGLALVAVAALTALPLLTLVRWIAV
ncbi:hypothetical protein [Rhizobium sp. BR 314]|uniref:hypothetical protein n=1 Tax=Rhizobium sp. BR 314 TaxID=3040013 RepID=UPI0039BF9B46